MIKIKNTLTFGEFTYLNSFVVKDEIQLLLVDQGTNRIILRPYNDYVRKYYKVEINKE